MMSGTFVRNFLAGVLIGIGAILPGVSGGVMAVSFGLYRPMLDAVTGIFHDTKAKLKFLLPLVIGGGLGVLLGAFLLGQALRRYESVTLCLFAGFILGGVPDLLHQAQQGGRLRLRWLWALAGGILLALPLALAGGTGESIASLSPLQAFLCGLLEGVGTVVPGVSTSFVMMRLGWYPAFLTVVSAFSLREGVLIAAGFALSAALCIKAVKWLFDRYTGYAYYGVLGFLLVSVALVLPGFESGAGLAMQLAALAAGLLCARRMSALGEPNIDGGMK